MDIPLNAQAATSPRPPVFMEMALLTALFMGRVGGQALQCWHPQTWLPPFDAWQGSALPYPILLAAQLAIVALMVRTTGLAWRGLFVPTSTTAARLRIAGGAYLGLSIARLAVGVCVSSAPAWFSAWISGVFHVVLAAFVLAAASCGGPHHAPARSGAWRAGIASYVWYPLVMGLALMLFLALLEHGAPPVIAAYVPVIAAGVTILRLERHFPLRDDWRPGRAELVTDAVFLGAVMVLLPRLLMAGAVVMLAGQAGQRLGHGWWPHDAPLVAQIVLMVLCVDFLRYWLHRACHRFGPLWRLHEVHHAPDGLHMLNVGRFHPFEKALHFALDTLPFLWLGVQPSVLAGYFLAYSVNGFFQHCNVQLRHGWLNIVVASAETHRWHHARDPRVAACNFSNTTGVWDVLFGTWHLPGPAGDVGIPDRRYPRGFIAQLRWPLRDAGGRLAHRTTASVASLLSNAWLRWTMLCARWRLARTLRSPMRVQRALLARILADNEATAFGREHGFRDIDGPAAYAAQVPVRDGEALRPYIESEIATGRQVLTAESPVCYARTSGTTGTPKDIPMTPSHLASLRRSHHEAVAFQHRVCPEAFDGSILAMVSPACEGMLGNGRPYGAASGIVARSTPWLLRDKFVVPAQVLTLTDSRVKYLLALRLAIARDDVSSIVAANPTTLLTMMKLYREHAATLVADVRDGTFFLAHCVPLEIMRTVRRGLRPDPDRARTLERLPAQGDLRLCDLWPAARLIVTWTCASAGIAADALKRELSPSMRMMELGYLASEFRATVTLGRRRGSGLPTFETHFFEFVDPEQWEAGRPDYLTLDRVEKGRVYHVVVTTPSGLYRCFMNDMVRVTGFLHATPLLEFVQKGKGVTNLTGEKLHEAQVLRAVRESLAACGRSARFLMMLADEQPFGYTLHVEPDAPVPRRSQDMAATVDALLCALNVEYAAKRESGRLAALRLRWLAPDTGERYKQHCVSQGQREGQFKMVAIDYRRRFGFDLDAFSVPA